MFRPTEVRKKRPMISRSRHANRLAARTSRLLIDQYPREVWPTHANLGSCPASGLIFMAVFASSARVSSIRRSPFARVRSRPAEFRAWFQPRLRYFLSGLEGHHQIEDHQFFPLFGAAEPRLATGFDVLERDHEVIHQSMDEARAAANAFLVADLADRDLPHEVRRPLRRRGGCAACAALLRHLDDEEDLIIPLILERSERALGL